MSRRNQREQARPFARRIGVLCGGPSTEKAISMQTGEAALAALLERGYDARLVVVDSDLDQVLRAQKIEIAFLATHGRIGEDGCLQGLLEVRGIPYTGSGVLASALAMDKAKAKEIFRLYNLPTPPSYVVTQSNVGTVITDHRDFGFPVIVKPVSQGSSLGVAVARNRKQLLRAVLAAFAFDRRVLVERLISGTEVSVAILGDEVLGSIEIAHSAEFFDFAQKYATSTGTRHLPPRLSPERISGAEALALSAHRALGCTALSRVDIMVSELGNEYLLEVNTLPGMTPKSLFPKIASSRGLSYADLVEEILFQSGIETRSPAKDVSFPKRGGRADTGVVVTH